MSDDEKMKLDYQTTVEYHHKLGEFRFCLLALIPVATTVAIGLTQEDSSGLCRFAVGVFGFLMVIGLLIYDQRNSEICDELQMRAKVLEARLGFGPLDKEGQEKTQGHEPKNPKKIKKYRGGAFLDRPEQSRRLFKVLMWHDRALAIIYATSLGGWFFLMADGVVRGLSLSNPGIWCVGCLLVIAVLCVGLAIKLQRLGKSTDSPETLPKDVQRKVYGKEVEVKKESRNADDVATKGSAKQPR